MVVSVAIINSTVKHAVKQLLSSMKIRFNSGKICRVELHTELFYAIIPTLFPCFFLICVVVATLHMYAYVVM